MKGGPINLNRVRKSRARDAAKQQADVNVAKHGRTKAERDLAAARRTLSETRHDEHQTDD